MKPQHKPNPVIAAMGRKGGLVTSEKKRRTSIQNLAKANEQKRLNKLAEQNKTAA